MATPKKLNPPHLPVAEDELRLISRTGLDHDESISWFRAVDGVLPAGAARGVTAETGVLEGVNLSDSIFDAGAFSDLILRHCDLANLRAKRASLTRVLIESGRLTGLSLNDSALFDVTFRNCRLDLSSFGLSNLTRVRFEDCHLAGISLFEAKCTSVGFYDCRMTECDFRGARLKDCEFRRCDLAGIEGIEALRGTAMEWTDIIDLAGTWAAALGIEVIEAVPDQP